MDEEDQYREKEEEDFRQDKIVIYNEVLDVMRSIAHMFRKKIHDAKAKRNDLLNAGLGSEYDEQLLFGNSVEQDSGRMSLSMDKSLIIEAWGRYRPSSKENSPRNNGTTSAAAKNKKKDIQAVFGAAFMKRIIGGVR